MGEGKLRNHKCPCNSGKKYKNCHWPISWRAVAVQSVILSQPKVGEPLPAFQPSTEPVMAVEEGEIK